MFEGRGAPAAMFLSDALVCVTCLTDTLISHQHRSHGYRNPFRRVTIDETCPACETSFTRQAKAVDHVAYRLNRCRNACLSHLVAWASQEDAAVSDGSYRQATGKRGRLALLETRSFKDSNHIDRKPGVT